MMFRLLLSGALIAAPATALAQSGPVSEKSEAQIVCELTSDCDAFNQELASRDKGALRDFSMIRKKGSAKPTVAAVVEYAAPKKRAVAAPGKRAYVATQPAVAAMAKPGQTTLPINFASGSASILPGSRAQAQRLANAIKQSSTSGSRFIVGGHTDSVGGREYNLELSNRRAHALVDFLVSNGVDRSRLQPEGYGFDKPLPGLTAKAAANRRVEIVKID
ncbi:OmpA family protein [Novosphingobium sp.]|uniref:OmpA family protein n=1 Tax=Novosphingobium sp. TaxID=1874826 RepID=UPI003563E076